MIATIQLDVLGTDTPGNTNFSIFTDSDSFTNVVTTRTGTQLLAGTSVTVPDGSTTVRLTTSSGCGILKDISIDHGDTSPSITLQSSVDHSTFYSSIVGDGMNQIIAYGGGNFALSLDNGLSYSTSVKPSSVYGSRLIHNKENLFIVGVNGSEDTLHVYRITDYLGGFDTANYDLIHSQSVDDGASVTYADYLNGKYYIGLNTGLHRSSGIVDGFILVIPNIIIKDMDSYGNRIEAISASGVNHYYFSDDNGLNWDSYLGLVGNASWSSGDPNNIFIESYDKSIASHYNSSTSNYTSIFTTRRPPNSDILSHHVRIEYAYNDNTSFIIKYNSAYIMRSDRNIYIIPDDPYAYSFGETLQISKSVSDFPKTTSYQYPGPVYLMQRNSLTFVTESGLSSYIISNT